MELTEQILQRLDRIERLLEGAKRGKSKTWVKAAMITKATGWNNEQMRQARVNGYVEFKKEEGSFFYNLDSIHPSFIK